MYFKYKKIQNTNTYFKYLYLKYYPALADRTVYST